MTVDNQSHHQRWRRCTGESCYNILGSSCKARLPFGYLLLATTFRCSVAVRRQSHTLQGSDIEYTTSDAALIIRRCAIGSSLQTGLIYLSGEIPGAYGFGTSFAFASTKSASIAFGIKPWSKDITWVPMARISNRTA